MTPSGSFRTSWWPGKVENLPLDRFSPELDRGRGCTAAHAYCGITVRANSATWSAP